MTWQLLIGEDGSSDLGLWCLSRAWDGEKSPWFARFRLEMITGWLLRGLCRMIIALGLFPGLPASCHRSSFVWILVHALVGW